MSRYRSELTAGGIAIEEPDGDLMRDERIQREADDARAAEIALKRNAAGISAEELSLQDAFMEGQRAGQIGTAAGCNPFVEPTLPQYREWERGRSSAVAYKLSRRS